jgi:hypothetical protein
MIVILRMLTVLYTRILINLVELDGGTRVMYAQVGREWFLRHTCIRFGFISLFVVCTSLFIPDQAPSRSFLFISSGASSSVITMVGQILTTVLPNIHPLGWMQNNT